MQAIVDTNVWVSAFLTPAGTSAQLLNEVKRGRLMLVYSLQIEAEYREILSRPKFNIHPDFLVEFILRLEEDGQRIVPKSIPVTNLPDPSDAPFIAAALTAGCPIVTGNARHFPADCGVEILTPAQCLTRLTG
jgi:putative PIN family toxin of toxin-antitoxin system